MANTKVTSGIIALVVTALLVGGVVYAKNANNADESTATPATTSQSTDTTETVDSGTAEVTDSGATASYEDGTYSATGSYQTPGGQESITVSVTLQNDVITATSATGSGKDGDSQRYQSRFIGGYKSLVVGKKISDVELNNVSGSSLTSSGFNDALDQIERQAAV